MNVPTTTVRGESVPRIGLGTSKLRGREGYEAVRAALDLGYRLIDTAASYGNEAIVGEAMRDARVDRESIFLVTKVWHDQLDEKSVLASLRASLRRLDTDHVDLAFVHWPTDEVPLSETLHAFQLAQSQGLCHHFGVSNFTPELLAKTLEEARPFALQVEYHPFLDQRALLDATREHEMLFVAYSPLMRGEVGERPVLQEIARAHEATPHQVSLAWLLRDPHVVAIPKATTPGHLVSNLHATQVTLDDAEIARIRDELPKDERLVDPEFAPDWS